jgi:hypothetical protein
MTILLQVLNGVIRISGLGVLIVIWVFKLLMLRVMLMVIHIIFGSVVI